MLGFEHIQIGIGVTTLPTSKPDKKYSLEQLPSWQLEDAQAQLSEIINLAQTTDPQRITVQGEDAVVVLSAETFQKLLPLLEQPSLQTLLSQSPLNQLALEPESYAAPVRPVEL